MIVTFFDCTADLVGQLNVNGQKGMLQIDAPPVENFWLRHCSKCNINITTNVLVFHPFFQGESADPICPYVRTPMI